MSMSNATYPGDGILYDPYREPALFDGVLTKRVLAFFIDAFLILALLVAVVGFILIMGIPTLGLAWLLFPALPLFPIVALLYVAFTLGGPRASTPGMRVVGLTIRGAMGERIGPLIAAVHALLFWFSVSILTPLVLIVGLLSNRKRLLHDLLLGTVVMNATPLEQTRR
ncbi:RDD family protein [Prosthecomicrobium pneumaticum]|uniref:Putative RDD family membrane protein YckC n=1 Tax=Prosthecomicrobium pneumaticum TaxID=81895 RepID=A0A7W9FQ45_9HYPH|nr:RDD family protein [Prosthecomicrobium pneumaticum]MBB5754740.1 putative RDD family membrane protein YckC [Prosthecomicrobium pneumaticum]